MKLIVYKKDIENFLNIFLDIADYDYQGNKHYFVFLDHIRNGDCTLMFYKAEKKWTIHCKGSDYCDENEVELPKKELIQFLYKSRKYINNELKSKKGLQTT